MKLESRSWGYLIAFGGCAAIAAISCVEGGWFCDWARTFNVARVNTTAIAIRPIAIVVFKISLFHINVSY
jgi:hypothetical protein